MNYWNETLAQFERPNDEFISRHFDQFDHFLLLEHLREKGEAALIEKYRGRFRWTAISSHQNLPEEFIEEFRDNVNWRYISQYQTLSESFIRKYLDRVDWYLISYHQKMSENFIREFKDQVDWNGIFRNTTLTLSEKFRKEFQNKAGG